MSYQDYGPYIPVIMLITFVLLFVWVLLPGNKKRFDEAAQAPFADEDAPVNTGKNDANNGRDL
ncbi:cbb3-type cytochrome oxidase subunit 3 [Marinobacterium jannaschii]|uniref:cbb3-type cytochrome oxidase subunit 3 n=1 Tax=Marinobacterium jannaschii TaxID=64970 RepID=UPI00068669F3|nr:cbb3-type cytochrome c oxidase subunit 3 [Marinobacterium jannaschii]